MKKLFSLMAVLSVLVVFYGCNESEEAQVTETQEVVTNMAANAVQ